MKIRWFLILILMPLLAAVAGCRTSSPPSQFSEVPTYMLADCGPEAAAKAPGSMVDLQILGARPGADRAALVIGTRKALGPASEAFPEQEKMRYAEKLTDRILAGNKVTLRLPSGMATSMARQLEEAGLIARVSE